MVTATRRHAQSNSHYYVCRFFCVCLLCLNWSREAKCLVVAFERLHYSFYPNFGPLLLLLGLRVRMNQQCLNSNPRANCICCQSTAAALLLPFALGRSGCELRCATGLRCIISTLQIVALNGIKVTWLAWRKGGGSVWVSAGVPVSQDLATRYMTEIFVHQQHCHGNHHSEFFDFSETKFSVLMLH